MRCSSSADTSGGGRVSGGGAGVCGAPAPVRGGNCIRSLWRPWPHFSLHVVLTAPRPGAAGEHVCRICWDGSEAAGNKLVAPCACAGSMRHVHAQCLAHWQQQLRAQKGLGAARRCDVCKAPFARAHQLPAGPTHWRLMLRDILRRVPWPAVLEASWAVGGGQWKLRGAATATAVEGAAAVGHGRAGSRAQRRPVQRASH